MLLTLPGITSRNVNFLLDGFENMISLVEASREKLRKVLLDESCADKLHDFINSKIKASFSAKQKQIKNSGYQKWKETKSKK